MIIPFGVYGSVVAGTNSLGPFFVHKDRYRWIGTKVISLHQALKDQKTKLWEFLSNKQQYCSSPFSTSTFVFLPPPPPYFLSLFLPPSVSCSLFHNN